MGEGVDEQTNKISFSSLGTKTVGDGVLCSSWVTCSYQSVFSQIISTVWTFGYKFLWYKGASKSAYLRIRAAASRIIMLTKKASKDKTKFFHFNLVFPAECLPQSTIYPLSPL